MCRHLRSKARILERQAAKSWISDFDSIDQQIAQVNRPLDALLNNLLAGVISQAIYATKSANLEQQRGSLERRRDSLSKPPTDLSSQLEAPWQTGVSARMDVEAANNELEREVLSEVLCNLTVKGVT